MSSQNLFLFKDKEVLSSPSQVSCVTLKNKNKQWTQSKQFSSKFSKKLCIGGWKHLHSLTTSLITSLQMSSINIRNQSVDSIIERQKRKVRANVRGHLKNFSFTASIPVFSVPIWRHSDHSITKMEVFVPLGGEKENTKFYLQNLYNIS